MSTADQDLAEWAAADRHDRATYRRVGSSYYDENDLPDLADVTDQEQP